MGKKGRRSQNEEYIGIAIGDEVETGVEVDTHPTGDMAKLHRELDHVIDQTVNDEPESDLSIIEIAPKIDQICNDIRSTMAMVKRPPVPNISTQQPYEGSDYFEFADVEVAIINLLKEQVKALKNITDRI